MSHRPARSGHHPATPSRNAISPRCASTAATIAVTMSWTFGLPTGGERPGGRLYREEGTAGDACCRSTLPLPRVGVDGDPLQTSTSTRCADQPAPGTSSGERCRSGCGLDGGRLHRLRLGAVASTTPTVLMTADDQAAGSADADRVLRMAPHPQHGGRFWWIVAAVYSSAGARNDRLGKAMSIETADQVRSWASSGWPSVRSWKG